MADWPSADPLDLIPIDRSWRPRRHKMDKKLIVVSAENNAYMAWQCKLFRFSCTTRLKHEPLIIAHDTGVDLHPDFGELIRIGGNVRTAPSYKRTHHGDSYPPRNTPGTLLHALEYCDSRIETIILCDPDLLFVRSPEFPADLSGDYCSYMNYDLDCVEAARRVLKISPESVAAEKETLRCGVPYSIPVRDAQRIGEAWLDAIDAFPPRRWEDVMYAFGLAATRLGMKVTLTRLAQSNYWPDARLESDVVHYCYGDDVWSKRHYFRQEQAAQVWQSPVDAVAGTVMNEISSQIREAREFYSLC